MTTTINKLKESYDSPSHFKKGIDAEYKAPKFAQARVIKGKSYGSQPDEEDPNKEVIDKPVKLGGDAPKRGRPAGSLGAAKKAAAGMHGSALHDLLMGKVSNKLPQGRKRVVKFGESEEIVAENSISIDEAKKKIGEYSHEGNVTKVYKLSGEHNEGDPYKVELHRNGKHYEPADYFTNDHDDAHGTAQHMVKEDAESKKSVSTLLAAAKRYTKSSIDERTHTGYYAAGTVNTHQMKVGETPRETQEWKVKYADHPGKTDIAKQNPHLKDHEVEAVSKHIDAHADSDFTDSSSEQHAGGKNHDVYVKSNKSVFRESEETTIDEMAMGSKKSASGKKVEWTSHPGLGHSVTVNGVAAHHGFLDHAAASKLYAKHIAE